MHNNLFSDGHERAEVKAILIENQNRDHKVLKLLDFVTALCLLFELRHQSWLDSAATFIGIFAALSALRYFIDLSNRNFYLHRLDWEEAAGHTRLEKDAL